MCIEINIRQSFTPEQEIKLCQVLRHVSACASNRNLSLPALITFAASSETKLFKFMSEWVVFWICRLDDKENLIQNGNT